MVLQKRCYLYAKIKYCSNCVNCLIVIVFVFTLFSCYTTKPEKIEVEFQKDNILKLGEIYLNISNLLTKLIDSNENFDCIAKLSSYLHEYVLITKDGYERVLNGEASLRIIINHNDSPFFETISIREYFGDEQKDYTISNCTPKQSVYKFFNNML